MRPTASQSSESATPTGHEAFREAVYAATRRIPYGEVASYGTVAAMAGKPLAARAVGAALKQLPEEAGDVPWHRVVNAQGQVSPRGAGDPVGALGQRERLEAEGHRFDAKNRILGLKGKQRRGE